MRLVVFVGPTMVCQEGEVRSVASCTWYGAMPPLQLNKRFVPCSETIAIIAGAGFTVIFIVALLDLPPGSVALTTKLFAPSSAENGVPDRVPFAATASHEGPLTFPNEMLSPFGSVAFVAIVPE